MNLKFCALVINFVMDIPTSCLKRNFESIVAKLKWYLEQKMEIKQVH